MNPTTLERINSNTATYRTASLLFIAACVSLIWRAPDSLIKPQFWAEDGVIFFQQQFGHQLPQVFTTYAGYLHATPRLIAWLATAFSYANQPIFYNVAALIIGATSITYFAQRASSFANPWVTILAFALVPTDGEEFGTITNIQWLVQFALVASCLFPKNGAEQGSIFGRILRVSLLLIASLTGPFSIFCTAIIIAVFAINQLASRAAPDSLIAELISSWLHKLDKTNSSVVALGGVTQTSAILFFGVRANKGPFSLAVAKRLFSDGLQRHIFGTIWMPNVVFVGLVIAVIASLLYVAYSHRNHLLLAPMVMMVFAFMQVLSVTYAGSLKIIDPDNMSGDRYYFFLKIVVWLSVASTLGGLATRRGTYQAATAAAIIAVAILSPQSISRTPLVDMHWRQYTRHLDEASYPIEIPINPAPWKVTLISPNQHAHHE